MNTQIDISNLERIGDDDHDSIEISLSSGEQYLVFTLGDELYGINILSVTEISGWDSAALVPNAPNYVKGVINLRGNIVPIIDLRIRFEVGEVTYPKTTVVVILSGLVDGRERTVGFIVDSVSDVLDIEQDSLQCSSSFDGTVAANYIDGIINAGDDVVTILDTNKLLSINS